MSQTIHTPFLEEKNESPYADSEGLNKVRDAIREFGELDEDWDTEGAKAVSSPTVELALNILDQIVEKAKDKMQLPALSVDGNGSIHLTWRNSCRSVLFMVRADNENMVRIAYREGNNNTSLVDIPTTLAGEWVNASEELFLNSN